MDEIRELIDRYMKDKAYDQALILIESELAQPYLPKGYLEVYTQYKQEILSNQLPIKKHIEPEKCFEMLRSDDHPLVALSYLKEVPLTHYANQIQDLFDRNHDPLVIGLLIQLCIEQRLSMTFVLNRNGYRYEFIPMYVMGIEESEGFQAIVRLIREVFENDNPSLMQMCLQILMQESILHLPLNLEEDEQRPLGFAIIRYVLLAMEDKQQWQQIKILYDVDEDALQELSHVSTH